jgi:hypothetical protein
MKTGSARTMLALAATVSMGICFRFAGKTVGWTSLYSAYFGVPNSEALVAKAHLWTRIDAAGALLFWLVSTQLVVSLIQTFAWDIVPTVKYFLAAAVVAVIVAAGVISASVFGASLYHLFG